MPNKYASQAFDQTLQITKTTIEKLLAQQVSKTAIANCFNLLQAYKSLPFLYLLRFVFCDFSVTHNLVAAPTCLQ